MKRLSLATRFGPWGALAVLLAAAAVAYGPALAGPFVLDDWGSIQANMRLRQPDAIRPPSLAEMLGPSRPVTEVTFAIDYRAAGLDPARFHAVGLALHLAAVVLAFAFLAPLLRRAGHPRPRGVALVVAGIFALHPIQAEAVAYAAQRSEVLASLLYLLALALLDRAAAGWGTWRGAATWAGGAIAWLVAMGAKTIAISVPGAFVVDQVVVAPATERGAAPLRRRALRALALVAPLLALGAWSASLHFRSFAENPGGGAGFSETPLSAGAYFLTQLRVHWLYLRLLAWPRGLAFDRFFEPSLGPDGAVLAAGAGVVALLALAALLWARAERSPDPRPAERVAAFGILFWFVALSPTSSFVPVTDLAVEHRVYLASLGPFLAATVGADALLHRLLPSTGAATRVGISGAPGAGKSTFIEALGTHVCDGGHRVAVLAVDPSSRRSGGSILGDKTRMERLARRPEAFIRPSPSSGSLGGVARRTREALLVCEAAGFDVVLVETVGVGQSEMTVAGMVDLFLLLLAPAAGDELQGVKRGVVELAELLVVNKADGDLLPAARRTAADYASALRLLRPRAAAWSPQVLTCSALTGHGVPEVWNAIEAHRAVLAGSGELEARRAAQATEWMWSEVTEGLLDELRHDSHVAREVRRLEKAVAAGSLSATEAAQRLLRAFRSG